MRTYDKLKRKFDMERTKAYDIAIKKSIRPIIDEKILEEPDGVYFGKKYCERLIEKLNEAKVYDKFKNEITKCYGENNTKVKMCSVASSSRWCFLKFVDNNYIFEKVLTDDDVCKPHLDAYDRYNNVYYECKCHEIVGSHSVSFSEKYKGLLNVVFKVNKKPRNGKIVLDFKDLHFACGSEKLKDFKCGKYFDFKQFICHIIGILKVKNCKTKPTLQYVFFKPDSKSFEGQSNLLKWEKEISMIETTLFELLRNILVFINTPEGERLIDLVNLPMPESIPVSSIFDPLI